MAKVNIVQFRKTWHRRTQLTEIYVPKKLWKRAHPGHAVILALDSHIIKANSTLKAVHALKNLSDSSHVFLKWIPAHQGFDGNERADELAK